MIAESSSAHAAAYKQYRGWIATISGRLSYSVFGETTHPRRAVSANIADDKIRYVASYQFRDASDVLVPFRSTLAPLLFRLDGRVWFLFLAHTTGEPKDPQFILAGKAFLFADFRTWRQQALPRIKAFQKYLLKFPTLEQNDLHEYVNTKYAEILESCTSSCSFSVNVSIRRTGTTDTSLPYPPKLPFGAPKLPSDPEKLSSVTKLLVSQLFYFIREIGHRHQHHDPSTDQIVPLYEVGARNDDINWRHHTLFSIYRKVIEIKREPHISTFSDSLGLIAYAESFSKISKEEIGEGQLPTYYAGPAKDSIRSTQSRVERQYSIRQNRINIFRNAIIALAGIFLSLIGLLSFAECESSVEPNPVLISIMDWILVNPIIFLALLFIATMSPIYILTMEQSPVSVCYIIIVRYLQVLPRFVTIVFLILLALLGMCLFFALLP